MTPVRVSVGRDVARPTIELPYAVTRLSVDSARLGARRGSLTDLLLSVPGLSVSNRHNPTQDPRVSIRGFGARSAFGIRGLRVVRDGVPLTLADGQTAIDFVDLETVSATEVMRGAAGALFGNAAGGVLALQSDLPTMRGVSTSLRGTYNEDAQRGSATTQWQRGALAARITGSMNRGDGPRDYARFKSNSGFLDAQYRWATSSLRAQVTAYHSPLGENPGAVTAAELVRTPTVADSQNIRRRASKAVRHGQYALMFDQQWSSGSASSTAFAAQRSLYNPQPFAIVAFDRDVLGWTGRVQQGGSAGRVNWRLAAGADAQWQDDDRSNYANCAGLAGAQRPVATCPTAADRGSLTIHQAEGVSTTGGFLRAEASASRASLTATLRGDNTRFTVQDLRTAGAVEQRRSMAAVTPMIGATVRLRPTLSLYGNLAQSFETPTTTELANQPDGSAGLNRELKPQHGQTLEAGVKGLLGARVLLDVAVFQISTTDELIPFEIPNSGGRRYFRNAGRTSRSGAELGASTSLGAVDVTTALTVLRYTYDDFRVGTVVLDGRRVPGVSPFTAASSATWRTRVGYATVEMQAASRTAADDGNTNYAPGYVVWNARLGGPVGSAVGADWVLGVENAMDRAYAANIVTNATRARFFEPGAGRRAYAGLTLRWRQ